MSCATASQITMMGERVLVELIEEKTRFGIHIPETALNDPRIGRVIAVGNGRRLKNGSRIPIEGIKVGDRVLLPQGYYGGKQMEVDGKTVWSFNVGELLGVLEG